MFRQSSIFSLKYNKNWSYLAEFEENEGQAWGGRGEERYWTMKMAVENVNATFLFDKSLH